MKGRVVSKDEKGKLTISLMQDGDEHCRACGMGDTCGLTQVSTLEINLGTKGEDMNVNDFVDVEVSSKLFLWLSSSVYILPLATMLIGALVFSYLGKNDDAHAISGALTGLVAGIIFNIFLNKFLTLQRIVTVRRLR